MAEHGVVRAAQTNLWRWCAYLVGPDDADDLTQEVYVRAFRALPGYRADASARSWLLAIARRTAADHIRRQRRHRRAVRNVTYPVPGPEGHVTVAAAVWG